MIIDPLKVFSESSQQHLRSLFTLNMALAANGLPHYHLGDRRYNSDYSPYPTPRRLVKYRFPFSFAVELEQIYLLYKMGTPEQQDIVYIVSSDSIAIVEGKRPPER